VSRKLFAETRRSFFRQFLHAFQLLGRAGRSWRHIFFDAGI
jgi:hypothetical protein